MAKQGMGRRQFLDLLLRGTAAATMAVSGLDCTAQKQDSMHDSHDISDVVGQKQSEQAYTADKEVNHLTHLLVDWAESYNASAAQDPNTGKTVQEKLESAATFGETIDLDVRAAVEIYDTPLSNPTDYLAKQARSAKTMETLLDQGIVFSVGYSLNGDDRSEISLGIVAKDGRTARKTEKGRQYEQVVYTNIIDNHFDHDAQGEAIIRRQCFRRQDKVYMDLEHVDRTSNYLQRVGKKISQKGADNFAEQMYLEAYQQLETAARENKTSFVHEYRLMIQTTVLDHHEPEHFNHELDMPREEKEKQAYLKEIAEGNHRGKPYNALTLATLADCNFVPDFFEFFASKDALARMNPKERSELAKIKFKEVYE